MTKTLVVRRFFAASTERLFEAWTDGEALPHWWGPPGVTCTAAAFDLRVGGAYRIDNRMPDGTELTIAGHFLEVDRPRRLVYTWTAGTGPEERVTVDFLERQGGGEVIVTHTGIVDEPTREGHRGGWLGCLDGLARWMEDLGE